jgi:hypothetical protein
MIGKIAKAKQYAEEPDRLQFGHFEATFRGENDTHTISFSDGTWHCSCHFFQDWDICCHTMAAERLLAVTIPAHQRQGMPITQPMGTLFSQQR